MHNGRPSSEHDRRRTREQDKNANKERERDKKEENMAIRLRSGQYISVELRVLSRLTLVAWVPFAPTPYPNPTLFAFMPGRREGR